MTVVGESGLPHDAGRRDALHHRERLRKKITEQLKERIGEEDIVAAGPREEDPRSGQGDQALAVHLRPRAGRGRRPGRRQAG